MKRLSGLTFVFAILMLVFIILLVFLRYPFPFYPLMSWQDVIDLLTPLVLIPVYWLMFRRASQRQANLTEEVLFVIVASVWVLGHGMHLAANSIDNLIEGLAKKGVLDVTGSAIYQLAYFTDEHLSHYFWHIGMIGLAILILYREWVAPSIQSPVWGLTWAAGVIHGFTLFCVFLEGQTVLLGLPFTGLITLTTLLWGRKKIKEMPILAFFFVSCLLAFVLLVGWWIYWGGFPQFSDVGLI